LFQVFKWLGYALAIYRTEHGYRVVRKPQFGTLKWIKRNQGHGNDLWMCWAYVFIYNITLSSLYFGDVCSYVLYSGWAMGWNVFWWLWC